jgi:hypothetical protein
MSEPLKATIFVGRSDGTKFIPLEPGRWAGWLARYRDRTVTAILEPERRRRSQKQNDRYWAALVPAYMEWVGEDDKLQAHEDILSQCNRDDRLLPTGEVIQVVKRSRFLTMEEHCEFTGRVERWLAQHGVEVGE